MYAYIKGTLIETTPTKAIVDVGGVGYQVLIPLSSSTILPQIGEEVFLHTILIVREDAHILYGFMTKEEKNIFELLIGVSGIGPKTALSIVGHLDFAHFHEAIYNGNPLLLSKIPGIGKKTAERLIVELKDKCTTKMGSVPNAKNTYSADAIAALINLGYSPIKAQKAVLGALEEHPEGTTSTLVTRALKKI